MEVKLDRLLSSSSVVGGHVHNNHMAGIVASSETSADVDVSSEDVDELLMYRTAQSARKLSG